ncbi:hypothetical protein CPB86DRAFT_370176 [Serendipita vermifera]|nr:hypothetical protein CPB86DRAFT_370176 [Serendipita vermifera]
MAFNYCFDCWNFECKCNTGELQTGTNNHSVLVSLPLSCLLLTLPFSPSAPSQLTPPENGATHLDHTKGLLLEAVTNILAPAIGRQPKNNHTRLVPTRDTESSDESFINRCFPHDHQYHLREQLQKLLQEVWLLFNIPEPDGSFQFLLTDIETDRQQCVICAKPYRKGCRAIEHIRAHLSHRPFHCGGGFDGCAPGNCGKSFHSQEAMRGHQRRGSARCDVCQAVMLQKNLERHKRKRHVSRSLPFSFHTPLVPEMAFIQQLAYPQ